MERNLLESRRCGWSCGCGLPAAVPNRPPDPETHLHRDKNFNKTVRVSSELEFLTGSGSRGKPQLILGGLSSVLRSFEHPSVVCLQPLPQSDTSSRNESLIKFPPAVILLYLTRHFIFHSDDWLQYYTY